MRPPGGTLQDIGTLPGFPGPYAEAFDINNHGQIVGGSTALGAFIMQDDDVSGLNALIDPAAGWTIGEARAIDDHGQIAATGLLGGTRYAVLLTPVPEPVSASMLGLGLGLLALERQIRQRRRDGLSGGAPPHARPLV